MFLVQRSYLLSRQKHKYMEKECKIILIFSSRLTLLFTYLEVCCVGEWFISVSHGGKLRHCLALGKSESVAKARIKSWSPKFVLPQDISALRKKPEWLQWPVQMSQKV